jgi:hypothetical protein
VNHVELGRFAKSQDKFRTNQGRIIPGTQLPGKLGTFKLYDQETNREVGNAALLLDNRTLIKQERANKGRPYDWPGTPLSQKETLENLYRQNYYREQARAAQLAQQQNGW